MKLNDSFSIQITFNSIFANIKCGRLSGGVSAIAETCKCPTGQPRHGEEARARSCAQSAGLAMLW